MTAYSTFTPSWKHEWDVVGVTNVGGCSHPVSALHDRGTAWHPNPNPAVHQCASMPAYGLGQIGIDADITLTNGGACSLTGTISDTW